LGWIPQTVPVGGIFDRIFSIASILAGCKGSHVNVLLRTVWFLLAVFESHSGRCGRCGESLHYLLLDEQGLDSLETVA
jgi:hypothetical protein